MQAAMQAAMPVLSRSPFFAQFRPEHLEKLERLGSLVHFSKDQVLCREDDRDSKFYVLLSGRVALEREPGRQPAPIDTLYPGDELGWPAIPDQRKEFSARALEPVEALAFDAGELRLVFDSNPQLGRAFLERLCGSLARHLLLTRRQLGRLAAGGVPR